MDALKVHMLKKSMTAEEYAEFRTAFLNRLKELYELYESPTRACCQKCITSFSPEYYFNVPSKMTLKLIRSTPDTVNDVPELKNWFHDTISKLNLPDREIICNWPSQYVELGVVLLCHTFHSEKVQCFFLPDGCLPKEVNIPI